MAPTNYLYGDSSPSRLTSNFLELLRDAIDFTVFVLQADVRIDAGKARIAVLHTEASAEAERLDRFIGVVADAILSADKGEEGTPTAECATRLAAICASEQRASAEAIRSRLAADVALIETAEAETRDACHAALGTLLRPHLPPDSTSTRRLAFGEDRRYAAHLDGQASFALGWTFTLEIGEGSAWAAPLRVERFAPILEIRAPQLTGWISKEVKVKPLRLERHLITVAEVTGFVTRLELRLEPELATGFDLEIDGAAGTVKSARVGPDGGEPIGPFEVHPDDVAALVALADKIRFEINALELAELDRATFDGVEIAKLPRFAPLVDRWVEMLAPIVREISARSLTPTELVLRRALADDRREEFFLAKSTLREKYGVLAPELQAHFAPLSLDDGARSPAPPLTASKAPPPPESRAEIASSKPTVKAEVSSPPPLPKSVAPPSAPRPSTAPPPSGEGRNERFVEAVKRIVLVLKSGRTDEGYQQYAELLLAESFVGYRPDDQRQALKMLLLAKPPAERTEPVNAAYRAAIDRIQSLIDAHADPADYEMLGVARLQLEDRPAARTAFELALKLERARNPSSDLAANLERRLNQVSAST